MISFGDVGTKYPLSRPALFSLLVYGSVSALVGDVWPFSRFPMYADIPTQAAVPIVQANGEEYFAEEMVDYFGCTGAQTRIPKGVPSRVGWRQNQIAHWVDTHSAETPGEVPVRFGYRMVRVDDSGPYLDAEFIELCSGSARWSK